MRSPWGRADERVVAAIRAVLEAHQERSTGTLGRLRRQVGWLLEDAYGLGVDSAPPITTGDRGIYCDIEANIDELVRLFKLLCPP